MARPDKAGETMSPTPECRACAAGIATSGARICPECAHVFQGSGWDGIDAHWRSKHESLEPYEEFFASLCDEHRRTGAPLVAVSQSDLRNEATEVTRLLAGKIVRVVWGHRPDEIAIEFTDGARLVVDRAENGLELSLERGGQRKRS